MKSNVLLITALRTLITGLMGVLSTVAVGMSLFFIGVM